MANAEGDLGEAPDAAEDLADWLASGGFAPTHEEQVAAGVLCVPTNLRALAKGWRRIAQEA
jgi:hypothetical protein